MVVLPPAKPPRLSKFLMPYVLRMHFTNKYVNAQVVHTPTATVAASASSQEKALRESMENTRDVAAAAHIGKLLAERLLLGNISGVRVHYKREQRYHGSESVSNARPSYGGEEASEAAVKVTRSIMIVKPPGHIQTGSPPVSPAGSTPPVSPFSGGRESFRFRRNSLSDAYEKASEAAGPKNSPNSPYDV